MLIKIGRPSDVKLSEITPISVFMDRRRFMMAAATGVGLASVSLPGGARAAKFKGAVKGPYGTDEEQTPFENVTRYNNFYELGTGKGDPARNAAGPRPDLGASPSAAMWRSPGPTTSTTWSSLTCWKSASTVCATSRRG